VVLCLLLWGMAFPMSAQATTHSTKYLVPVGHTIGIKLFARGVLVVDSGSAKDSGIRVGDMLLQCNGTAIQSIEQFSDLLQRSGGTVTLTLRRGSKTLELPVPVTEGADGVWRLGAWIRDSMAGIGTMTFYDPETGVFGALGHGVTDTDTALLMPLSAGAIMESTVKAVKRGEEGCAGELRGDFNLTEDMGTLSANSDCGVFGQMERENWSGELGEALPIAAPGEVKTGKATILANVTGDTVEEYGVEISRVYP
ncbi:MAG: SpoIVB peptidase S55 domain-containing protein, partial [Oscillospiraceae bacterium]